MVGDVGGDDLGRAATLELERVEAVVGGYIEAALAADVGPGQAVDLAPEIEPAGRERAVGKLEVWYQSGTS